MAKNYEYKSISLERKTALARERLRRRYLPSHVHLLFVGESPPASGRFFYQADSGLYRAIRNAFVIAFPDLRDTDFLESFRSLGCYLADLCGMPVDDLNNEERRHACAAGEVHLSKIIKRLQPAIIITVVLSIARNVDRAQQEAKWTGPHFALPYPGQWHRNRVAFLDAIVPLLRAELGKIVGMI
jgi:hypothetical protein